MRIKEERRAEKEWKKQEFERRREEKRIRVMEESICSGCRGFGHVACHCRKVGEEGPAKVPLNKFEMLKDKIIQRGEGSGREVVKDRKEILREERAKRGIEVR